MLRLSKEEKREMLKDALSKRRKRSFRTDKTSKPSFDEYLSFLASVQKIFSPFKISTHTTPAEFNKL